MLRISSQQITFKTKAVQDKMQFDLKLGAGTGNGGGEETKFLLDCYKAGLQIFFVPFEIAELIVDSSSTWFWGWNEKYFYSLGQTLRYILGAFLSRIYISYTLISKRKKYKKTISFWRARREILNGWSDNRLQGKEN